MGTANLGAFFKLIRIEYSLFAAFGVIIGGLLAGDLVGLQLEYVVAFFIIFFCATGNFAFNDYYDYEVDKRNQRTDRPLVVGLLTKRTALIAGIVSFIMLILLSLLLNTVAMSLVLASLPIFFLYNAWLKKVFLVKNIVIAYAFVVTILLGSLVSDAILEPLIIYFATMGFIVGLGYEIMIDIGDVTGDKAVDVSTLATEHGTKTAAQVSVIIYALIMLMDPLPFLVNIDSRLHFDYVFLLSILIPVISYFFISRSLLKDQSKNNIFRLKKRVYLTMQVGCVAYLVGVFL
jgi:geranylgeranylglycerol-phosphate geranylgeranyltransferase